MNPLSLRKQQSDATGTCTANKYDVAKQSYFFKQQDNDYMEHTMLRIDSATSDGNSSSGNNSHRGVRSRHSYGGYHPDWNRLHPNNLSSVPINQPTPSPRQRRRVIAPSSCRNTSNKGDSMFISASKMDTQTQSVPKLPMLVAHRLHHRNDYMLPSTAVPITDAAKRSFSMDETRYSSLDHHKNPNSEDVIRSNGNRSHTSSRTTFRMLSSTSLSSDGDDNDDNDEISGDFTSQDNRNNNRRYRRNGSPGSLKNIGTPSTVASSNISLSSNISYDEAHYDDRSSPKLLFTNSNYTTTPSLMISSSFEKASNRHHSTGFEATSTNAPHSANTGLSSQSTTINSNITSSYDDSTTTSSSINNDILYHREKHFVTSGRTRFRLRPIRINFCYYVNGLYRLFMENWFLSTAIVAWFTVGVVSIVTTKILVKEWSVPPLVLTTQQLAMGSIILRIFLRYSSKNGTLQPWPWHNQKDLHNTFAAETAPSSRGVVVVTERTIPSTTNYNTALVRREVTNMNVSSNVATNNNIEISSNPNSCNVESNVSPDLNAVNNIDGEYDNPIYNMKNEIIVSSVANAITSSGSTDSVNIRHDNNYHHGHPVNPFDFYWRTFQGHSNFILSGIFFSLDFLFSNTAMSLSDASFVETVKASDPICTTTIALIYQVDKLSIAEGCSLALLVIGVLLSTIGNSKSHHTTDITPVNMDEGNNVNAVLLSSVISSLSNESTDLGNNLTSRILMNINDNLQQLQDVDLMAFGNNASQYDEMIGAPTSTIDDDSQAALWGSIFTASLVTTANLCFAFRAMNQKRYRLNTIEMYQMDDMNLLCRMLQIGALFLCIPTILLHGSLIMRNVLSIIPSFSISHQQQQQGGMTTNIHFQDQLTYIFVSLVNAVSYATYK